MPWHQCAPAHPRPTPAAVRQPDAGPRGGPAEHVASPAVEPSSDRPPGVWPGPRARPGASAPPQAPPAGGTRTVAASRRVLHSSRPSSGAFCPSPATNRNTAAEPLMVIAARRWANRFRRDADLQLVSGRAEWGLCAPIARVGHGGSTAGPPFGQLRSPECPAWRRLLVLGTADSVSRSGLTGEHPRISLVVMVWLLLVRDRALDYGRVVTCGCPPARAGLVR